MKEILDFSKARKNPYADKIKKEGYSIMIHYSPEDVANMSADQRELDLDPDELKALEKYQMLSQA